MSDTSSKMTLMTAFRNSRNFLPGMGLTILGGLLLSLGSIFCMPALAFGIGSLLKGFGRTYVQYSCYKSITNDSERRVHHLTAEERAAFKDGAQYEKGGLSTTSTMLSFRDWRHPTHFYAGMAAQNYHDDELIRNVANLKAK